MLRWPRSENQLQREVLMSSKSSHAIIGACLISSRSESMTVRVIRDGQPEPIDKDWMIVSPEERIEAVWMLTKLCLAWHEHSPREPTLQRTVTRLQRRKR